jgi:hypothetical protein
LPDQNSYHLCGNDGPRSKADNPLTPFTSIGDRKNTPDAAGGCIGAFDFGMAGREKVAPRFRASRFLNQEDELAATTLRK